jgi:hypothetical protein
MNTIVLAQIAPQRSTQYTALASQLAPHEIELSPLGRHIRSITPVTLSGQAYLKCDLTAPLDEFSVREFGWLAMTSAFFLYYERLDEYDGPFLKPIETHFTPLFPPDLVMTRRYQGKTNELFTHFLCNLARFSSDFSDQPWTELRLFDPLAGGGTTLFTGLVLGTDVAGVEHNKKNMHSTAVFLKQYTKEQRIPCAVKEERLKKLNAKRWRFMLGENPSRQCFLAKGETAQSAELIAGFKKPHLIVADLPYGIQHKGVLETLLTEALPVWASLLLPGGAMAFSWDSTRFPRTEMIALVESASSLNILNDPPYNHLAHRVDRVIKQRDVLIARLPAS